MLLAGTTEAVNGRNRPKKRVFRMILAAEPILLYDFPFRVPPAPLLWVKVTLCVNHAELRMLTVLE